MERVELLTEIEQRFNVRIPEEQVYQIFTVAQLIEAARAGGPAASGTTEDSWAVILRDLPSVDDPVLGALLKRKPIAERVFFSPVSTAAPGPPSYRAERARAVASERPVHHQPQSPGVFGPVHRLQRAALSRLPPTVIRRRCRVLRNTDDGVDRSEGKLRAG